MSRGKRDTQVRVVVFSYEESQGKQGPKGDPGTTSWAGIEDKPEYYPSKVDLVDGLKEELDKNISSGGSGVPGVKVDFPENSTEPEATGHNSVAVGPGTRATDENSASLGYYSQATGKNSVAVGFYSAAVEDGAVAIGPQARSWTKDQIVIGTSASTVSIPGNLKLTNSDLNSTGVREVDLHGEGRILISRFGPHVHLQFQLRPRGETISLDGVEGFRPATPITTMGVKYRGGMAPVRISPEGDVLIEGEEEVEGSVSYTTLDQWPDRLPGYPYNKY